MISGFGFQELFLIVVIVLIVFGPRRLPELMRQFARLTREFRRIAWEFRSALELESLDQDISGWKEEEKKSSSSPNTVSEEDRTEASHDPE